MKPSERCAKAMKQQGITYCRGESDGAQYAMLETPLAEFVAEEAGCDELLDTCIRLANALSRRVISGSDTGILNRSRAVIAKYEDT